MLHRRSAVTTRDVTWRPVPPYPGSESFPPELEGWETVREIKNGEREFEREDFAGQMGKPNEWSGPVRESASEAGPVREDSITEEHPSKIAPQARQRRPCRATPRTER